MLFFNEDTDLNTISEDTDGVANILIIDELRRLLTEEELKEFVESSECEALQEARVLKRRSIVRLSKTHDFNRRARLAALQIAKNKKDPLVKQLSKTIKLKRNIMDRIYQKNKSAAEKSARDAQRKYYRRVPALRLRIPGLDSTNFRRG